MRGWEAFDVRKVESGRLKLKNEYNTVDAIDEGDGRKTNGVGIYQVGTWKMIWPMAILSHLASYLVFFC